MNPCALIVHGGAWEIPDAEVDAHRRGVRAALEIGWERLTAGADALDAVEATVNVLEEDPTFDSGRGACLTRAGEVELDASIMDGSTLRGGGVAVIRNFLHPISIARRVMERTEHMLLAGPGAEAFALSEGFIQVPTEELLTERELARLKELMDDERFRTPHAFGHPRGTVGAVAMDRNGRIAAGTSTGGVPKKLPGRVGDTPILGEGTWADSRQGGASTTGWGEAILLVSLARLGVNLLERSESCSSAASEAIRLLSGQAKGLGGIILIDSNGEAQWAYNTPRMARGRISTAHPSFEVEC